MTLNINYFVIFEGVFLAKASLNRAGVVEIDVSAVFPLLYLRKFQK